MTEIDNPYVPPTAAATDLPIRGGVLRKLIYIFGTTGLGIICWALLLVVLFGDSSQLWPGFACAVAALVACMAVTYWLNRCRLRTGPLAISYFALNLGLFLAFLMCMFYWRIYIYKPDA